ncbi:cellulase family glycosylhydrolase [Catenibacterium sp.]|uniref:cellulase family glycosylhydrolase n=1 Tax=Catenibacterium sp. TaxID=2049022 RepID=UPI003991ECB5
MWQRHFFAKMAQQYASYNNVIYEICNEPCKRCDLGRCEVLCQRGHSVNQKLRQGCSHTDRHT